MSQDRETNLALFIDFDNVALGARDARQRFDVKLLLQRILEKGKIIVKRAYADWHHYKEHMSPLHEAAIELIEIPMPRISGKNSADIRLVVDAMDLCYSKHHIDTFVIVSGDSDFSPLVSKLRENNKRVIGVGVKNSSSRLLIGNCDEFIFYDDLYRETVGQLSKSVSNVPADKRDLFDFLVKTTQALLQENRGQLYSSLIKDTMTRKQPDFNERHYGYATFGDLLDDARRLGLLIVERDARAGGTWVVQGLGEGQGKSQGQGRSQGQSKSQGQGQSKSQGQGQEGTASEGNGKSRSSRRRRSRGGRGRGGEAARETREEVTVDNRAEAPADGKDARTAEQADATGSTGKTTTKKTTRKAPAEKTTKKAPAKKTTKKAPAKKTTKKAPAKKTTKKAPTRKTTSRSTKKKTAKKPPATDKPD